MMSKTEQVLRDEGADAEMGVDGDGADAEMGVDGDEVEDEGKQ